MTKQTEALKLALEALESVTGHFTRTPSTLRDSEVRGEAHKAIAAIREALAEQPAQQEPVAWKVVPVKPTDEMLKAMDACSKEGYDERLYAGHAASVYMAAVDAAPHRKPLTDEEFISMVDSNGIQVDPELAFTIKEMVEAAHGIKENT